MEKLREWIRARPITWLSIALIVALIVGGAIGQSGKSGLEDEKTSLESEVATAQEDLREAEASADDTTDELTSAEQRLYEYSPAKIREIESKSAALISKAKGEAKDILGEVEDEAQAEAARLEEIEVSLHGAEEEEAKSTIPANGTFMAEADYIPGTYRAPGGPSCYWATLNSADPNDIASNEIGSGPQIATIESPYFQTEGCGEWERIE